MSRTKRRLEDIVDDAKFIAAGVLCTVVGIGFLVLFPVTIPVALCCDAYEERRKAGIIRRASSIPVERWQGTDGHYETTTQQGDRISIELKHSSNFLLIELCLNGKRVDGHCYGRPAAPDYYHYPYDSPADVLAQLYLKIQAFETSRKEE